MKTSTFVADPDFKMITSVYSSDRGGVSIARLLIPHRMFIGMVGLWNDGTHDGDFLNELESVESDIYLFNGNTTPDGLESPLADLAKDEGVRRIKIAPPFKYSEAAVIFNSMKMRKTVRTSSTPGWPKLLAQIERDDKDSPDVMAYLQGLIEARKELRRGESSAPKHSMRLGTG